MRRQDTGGYFLSRLIPSEIDSPKKKARRGRTIKGNASESCERHDSTFPYFFFLFSFNREFARLRVAYELTWKRFDSFASVESRLCKFFGDHDPSRRSILGYFIFSRCYIREHVSHDLKINLVSLWFRFIPPLTFYVSHMLCANYRDSRGNRGNNPFSGRH